VTNLIGNGVATIVVGKWCGQVPRLDFDATWDARLKGSRSSVAAVETSASVSG